jgi:predicted Rossmann fold nucleotide-binding protein DprA/Smf involved in DNA uptake
VAERLATDLTRGVTIVSGLARASTAPHRALAVGGRTIAFWAAAST